MTKQPLKMWLLVSHDSRSQRSQSLDGSRTRTNLHHQEDQEPERSEEELALRLNLFVRGS
jgi:hypothetical protein